MSNAELRKALRGWLASSLPKEQADRLAYYLGDLHDAFQAAATRIAAMPTLPTDQGSPALRSALSGLMGELYEHMPTHLEGARSDLKPWVSRLYDDADARGEL